MKSTKKPQSKDAMEDFKKNFKRWQDSTLANRVDDGKIRPEYRTRNARVEKVKSIFKTGSGELEVKGIYTPLDIADTDPGEDIGLPGQFPYTRGRDPLGPQAAVWPMKFYSGFGSSRNAAERYMSLYKMGSRYITLAFDLPTQLGFDSDSPSAKNEVGKVGIALDTIGDLERALKDLPLNEVTAGTVGNCIGPWCLAMFHLVGKRLGYESNQMKITLQNDPIKEFTGRGTYIFSPRVSLDLASDMVEYILKFMPDSWVPQYSCSTTLRWGGCTATQEAGFGIANLIAYADAALSKGVSLTDFIPRVDLHMTADNDLFEEVAKFRAVRRLWAKIVLERFNTEDPRALSLRLTVYTGSHRLTSQEPLNNIVRTTIHALASVLGGVENISVPAHDEALALPTTASTRLASLIPHILSDECMVTNTCDPLGGSYFIEHLTNELEGGARYWYDQVEARGGALKAVESGYYLQEMADGMHRYQREVEKGERSIIGVNKYRIDETEDIELFQNDPRSELRQIETLRQVRRERDNPKVEQCIGEIRSVAEKKAAGQTVNIVPAMIEAVKSCATIGEIHGALRDVFGEYRLPIII